VIDEERIVRAFPVWLISAAFIAVVAGCASPATPAVATSGAAVQSVVPDARAAATGDGRIYSSSYGNSTVTYYDKGTGPNNPVAGSLSGTFEAPEGLAVDRAGNVYVANGDAQNVLVYASGASSPTLTLSSPNGFPTDVAVAPDGTVYVANVWGMAGNPGSVDVYAKGASEPTTTLSYRAFTQVVGIAMDRSGNLFVSYDANHGSVGSAVEFRHGKTVVPTKISVAAAGGIGFDGAGHMLLIDRDSSTLNVYDAGNTKPIHKLKLPGSPIYFAFGKNYKMLYVADYADGAIDVYRYTPSALQRTDTITNGMNASSTSLGIAVSPQ
jgi:WD40 repeat protein